MTQDQSGPRVRAVACVGGVSIERGVPTEELAEYVREADNLVWVDVRDPGPEELAVLEEAFGFHPLALEDVVHVHAPVAVLDLADPRRGELSARLGHQPGGGAHVHADGLACGAEVLGDVLVRDPGGVSPHSFCFHTRNVHARS